MLDKMFTVLCLGDHLSKFTSAEKMGELIEKIDGDARDTYKLLLKEIAILVDEDEEFLARCAEAEHYDEVTDKKTIQVFRERINERMDGYLSGPFIATYRN